MGVSADDASRIVAIPSLLRTDRWRLIAISGSVAMVKIDGIHRR